MRSLEIDGIMVNLSKDDTIRLVWENPFLSEDRVPIPASMDFSIEPTHSNLSIFGNPNRLGSKLNCSEKPAKFRFGPITLFEGVAKYNGFDGKIKLHLRSVEKANLGKNLCDLTLERVNFRNGTRYSFFQGREAPSSPVNGWGSDTYNPIFKDAADGNKNWVWGAIKIANEENTALNYIGLSDSYTDGYSRFGTYCKNPYPRVHYIFDKIFDGLLLNNPFKSDKFKNLVMPTMYHKDYPNIMTDHYLGHYVLDNAVYPKATAPVEMLYFDLSSFMPAYKAADFVKETLKVCGMVLYPVSRKYTIKTVEEIVTGTEVIDFSKFIGKLETEVVEGQFFDIEMNDIDEVEGAPTKVEKAIDIFNIPTTIDEPCIVEVSTTGEVFEITMSKVDVPDRSGKNCTFTVFNVEQKRAFHSAPAYLKSDDDKSTLSIVIKPYSSCFATPYSMERDVQIDAKLKTKSHYRYIAQNITDIKKRDYTPSIIHYCGINDTVNDGYKIPILTSHAYDCRGRKVAPFSLEPYGPDGILKTFYSSYKKWVERTKKRITGDFLLSDLDLANLDLSKKYSVNNVNFFVEKIEVDIAHDRILPARCSLIEA